MANTESLKDSDQSDLTGSSPVSGTNCTCSDSYVHLFQYKPQNCPVHNKCSCGNCKFMRNE